MFSITFDFSSAESPEPKKRRSERGWGRQQHQHVFLMRDSLINPREFNWILERQKLQNHIFVGFFRAFIIAAILRNTPKELRDHLILNTAQIADDFANTLQIKLQLFKNLSELMQAFSKLSHLSLDS